MTFSKVPNDRCAEHHRGNGAQEQQQEQEEQEEQQGTDSTHTATPEAKFTRRASHARHVTHDRDTDHGTRFPGWSITFSQPPIYFHFHKKYIYTSFLLFYLYSASKFTSLMTRVGPDSTILVIKKTTHCFTSIDNARDSAGLPRCSH